MPVAIKPRRLFVHLGLMVCIPGIQCSHLDPGLYILVQNKVNSPSSEEREHWSQEDWTWPRFLNLLSLSHVTLGTSPTYLSLRCLTDDMEIGPLTSSSPLRLE